MPRAARVVADNEVYHILNRRNGRADVFHFVNAGKGIRHRGHRGHGEKHKQKLFLGLTL